MPENARKSSQWKCTEHYHILGRLVITRPYMLKYPFYSWRPTDQFRSLAHVQVARLYKSPASAHWTTCSRATAKEEPPLDEQVNPFPARAIQTFRIFAREIQAFWEFRIPAREILAFLIPVREGWAFWIPAREIRAIPHSLLQWNPSMPNPC